MPINILDIDGYGSPWPTLEAFLCSRKINHDLWVCAHDGLRQKIITGSAWNVHSLSEIVSRRGNDIFHVYLDVCQELIEDLAKKAKSKLTNFAGYYCGHGKQMTHWMAMIRPIAESETP